MSRDTGDWEAFYRDQFPRVWRAVYVYAQSREIASDATSEAFAQSWKQWERIQQPGAWVFKVAFRVAAAEIKTAGQSSEEGQEVHRVDGLPDVDLLAALQRLSSRQRSALVLCYAYGFDSREVGWILGCTASTARVHIARAKFRIRRQLNVDEEGQEK